MKKSVQKKGQPKGYHSTLQWVFDKFGGRVPSNYHYMIEFIYGKTHEQIEIDFSRCKKTAP